MLPKNWRIVKDKEIKQVYFSKYKIKTQYALINLKHTTTPNFQLLVVVSKKIYKKANKRNRIKRKIHAIFSDLKNNSRLPTNLACIIQIKNKDIIFQVEDNIRKDILPAISSTYQKIVNFNKKNK